MNEAQLLGQLMGGNDAAPQVPAVQPTSFDPATGLPVGVSSKPAASATPNGGQSTTGGAMSMGGANLLAMLSSAEKQPSSSSAAPAASRSKRGAAVADKGKKGRGEGTKRAAAPAKSSAHKPKSVHALKMEVYGSCGGVSAGPPPGVSKKSFKPMSADELRRIGAQFLTQSAAGKPEDGVCENGRCAGAPASGPWHWPRKYLMWPHFLPVVAIHQKGPVLTANSRAVRRRQPKAAAASPQPASAASGRGRGDKKAPHAQRDAGDWRSAPASKRIDYERTDDIENDHVGDLATLPAFFQPVDDEEDDGGLGGLGGLDDDDDDGALEGGAHSTPPKSTPQPPLSAAAKKSERLRAKIESERLQQRREWAREEEEARLAAETREREMRAAGGLSREEEHSPGLLGSKPPSPQRSAAPPSVPDFAAHAGESLFSQQVSRAFGEGTPAPPQSPHQSPSQAPAAAQPHSASKLLARAKQSRVPAAGGHGGGASSSALQTLFASAKVVPASSGGGGGATALQMLQQAQRRGPAQPQAAHPPAAPGSSAVPLQYRGGLYTHAAVEGHATASSMQNGHVAQGYSGAPAHSAAHSQPGVGYGGAPPHMGAQPNMAYGGSQGGHSGMQAHPGYMQGGYMQQGGFHGQYAQPRQFLPGQAPGAPHSQPVSHAAFMHAMSMQHAQMAYSDSMRTQHTQQGAGQLPGQSSAPSNPAAPWAAATATTQAAPQASVQAQIKQQTAAVQGTAQRQQAAASARAAAGQLMQDKAAALQAATGPGGKASSKGKGKNKASAVHRMVPTTVIKRR